MLRCLDRRRLRPKAPRRAILVALLLWFLLLLWRNPHWIDWSPHKVLSFDTRIDLSHPEAKSWLCKQHGWEAFGEADREPRKVYDLLMVNNELDWLEIRLNTTYDHVSYFVIVESPKTFTNLDKPMAIKDNLDKFAAYRDKIIYHELEIPDGFHSDRPNPAWAWEDLQRDAMYKQVLTRLKGAQAPVQGDVIIVADVDEILRPQTIVVLKACDFPPRLNLHSAFYYYSFQFRHKRGEWAHPQATYFAGGKTVLPVNLRNSDGGLQPLIKLDTGDLRNAGWHCSSCFATIEELLTKMSSFSHTWMNRDMYRDKNRIVKYVSLGRDIWDRKTEQFITVENNTDVPPILLDQGERFSYMLDRSNPTASFKDFPP